MSNNPYQEHIHSGASQVQPNEPPPAYSKAPGPSSTSNQHHLEALSVPSSSTSANPNRLSRSSSDYTYDSREMEQELSSGNHEEHGSGIPIEDRVSMDEERRELPDGWIREFDANSKHWYYVDTKAKPPRSIWIHPYDDPQYLQSLPDDAPPRVAAENTHKLAQEISSKNSNTGNSSSSSHHHHNNNADDKNEKKTFGRKMKDKLTGTTHEEREKKRAAQRKAEAEEYKRYLERRKQLLEAQRNGTYTPMYGPPTDAWGRPVYGGYSGYSSYGYPGGRMYSPYGYGGRGYYGGGMGMGGGGMLAGGLLGGMLLGGALF